MHKIMFCLSLLLLITVQAQNYTDYLGAGHDNGITTTSSSGNDTSPNTINGIGFLPDLAGASRFLSQATLGADYESIEYVSQIGINQWLDEQFALPLHNVSFQQKTEEIWEYFKQKYIQQWGSNNVVNNDQVLPYWYYWRMAWWDKIMKEDDLLRHRIAEALSEILVVSEKSGLENSGPGLASYYDKLYDNAFGNYRDLLYEITMHPCMGIYLSHINNPKSDPINNIHPDENYAREIMQLFSIGLYELNNDGTRKKDTNGNDIPTYDNSDIKEFAKIFTGLAPGQYYWPWQDLSTTPVQWGNQYNDMVATINMTVPMQMFDNWHEAGTKSLLNGQVVPNGQTGIQDINDALDNLFNHPNVGPFIGHLLIQRLVKSNPTPAYVGRVADAFNNNGQGVRGDMQAVIRAILTDDEARNCDWLDNPEHGKLRSPLLRATQCLRAFNASNNSGKLWNWGYFLEENAQQHILASPSVFNFYLPEYQPNGAITDADLVAPEFQILTSTTAINWTNYMYRWFFDGWYMYISTKASDTVIESPEFDQNQLNNNDLVNLDFTDELALANNPTALVERINLILTGNQLSTNSKQIIINTVSQITNNQDRVKAAMYMIMISPDYNILK